MTNDNILKLSIVVGLFSFSLPLLSYTAIKCAEYLQPKFITIIDSDCHDHTTGEWVKIETGKKGK